MNPLTFPPVAAVLEAAYRALMALSDLLSPVLGGLAAAGAIVLVTLVVRAALIPVGISQAKAERTRARIAPRLAELQRRHRSDPEALQRAVTALYAEEGTTPFAGCLPMLAQAPVVGVIYALFVHAEIAGHANALLSESLLGAPLGTGLVASLGSASAAATAVLLAVIAAIALVGELTRRAARPGGPLAPATPSGSSPAVSEANPLGSPAIQRLVGLVPFATAVIACFVPLAAALYLLVTVAWTLTQRVILRRRYPIEPVTPGSRATRPPAGRG